MREELPSDAPSTASSQQVILLVGVNGAGKTTSAAKLAARAKAASLQPILVAADT
ncbi:MAG: signal recognition particle protein, partial [Chloroflexi bacterium]